MQDCCEDGSVRGDKRLKRPNDAAGRQQVSFACSTGISSRLAATDFRSLLHAREISDFDVSSHSSDAPLPSREGHLVIIGNDVPHTFTKGFSGVMVHRFPEQPTLRALEILLDKHILKPRVTPRRRGR